MLFGGGARSALQRSCVSAVCWTKKQGTPSSSFGLASFSSFFPARLLANWSVVSRARTQAADLEDFGAPACKRVVTISDLDPESASYLADELLYENGVTTSLEKDEERAEAKDEVFGGVKEKKLWNHCRLVVFMQEELDDEGAFGLIEKTASIAGIGTIDRRKLHVENFAESQYFHWKDTAMKAFEPVVVNENITVIPHREESDRSSSGAMERQEQGRGEGEGEGEGGRKLDVYITPGFAFGTGQHQTTKLCLVWLQENIDQKTSKDTVVLDYGSGSGILAIASVLLGASEAIATDIEEGSILAIGLNAKLNGIDDTQVRPILVDHEEILRTAEEGCEELKGIECDILMANILAQPLRELAKTFAKHTKLGGKIALSGMLVDQVDSVRAAFEEEGFEHFEMSKLDEWALLEGRRGK